MDEITPITPFRSHCATFLIKCRSLDTSLRCSYFGLLIIMKSGTATIVTWFEGNFLNTLVLTEMYLTLLGHAVHRRPQ